MSLYADKVGNGEGVRFENLNDIIPEPIVGKVYYIRLANGIKEFVYDGTPAY